MRKNERFAEGIEFHHVKFVLLYYYVGIVLLAVYNKTSKDPVILVLAQSTAVVLQCTDSFCLIKINFIQFSWWPSKKVITDWCQQLSDKNLKNY